MKNNGIDCWLIHEPHSNIAHKKPGGYNASAEEAQALADLRGQRVVLYGQREEFYPRFETKEGA